MGLGTYCYQVMPFRLKKVEATYQRLENKMSQKQIRASMEVYIDDMLVKFVSNNALGLSYGHGILTIYDN